MVKVSSEPTVQPQEAAVPTRPKGEAAPPRTSKRDNFGAPQVQGQLQEAPRFARRLRQVELRLGGPDFAYSEALGRAVSPFGRAGTAASSGWTSGSELILTKGLFDPVVVPAHGSR